MSISFKDNSHKLEEIIKNISSSNSTYLIPDLQRPYVWSPLQVIMLIDSVFKGWPFGTLLLWEVKPDCFAVDEGIPNRPFWQVVNRTKYGLGTQTSAIGQPATYYMVLDGQQRIQSLVIGLGGDKWGFKLYDSEWSLVMKDRRVKPSDYWSSSVLCVDLIKFSEELKLKENKVRKIEVSKILDWAILDITNGISTATHKENYEYPLMTAKDNPGRFIRLSRFWDLAQNSLTESEYEENLTPFLDEHSISTVRKTELLRPLSQFMKIIENVKNTSFVYSLKIESFNLTPQWTRDDYSDAIVNIFTRLNTAGRTLTREEITLAWLKIGWENTLTNGKTAGECLEGLKDLLEERGFKIEIDDVVRLISFMWSVDERTGELLDSKDLLKGDVIRPMAKTVSKNWQNFVATLEAGSDFMKERNIIEVQGSFNAAIIFMTWNRLAFNQFLAVKDQLDVPGKDALEKQIKEIEKTFLDRWIFCSQWANVWGEGSPLTFANFAKDLSEIKLELSRATCDTLLEVINIGVSRLMKRVTSKATDYVNNTVVKSRNRVSLYYTMLWVWHRLDESRWKYSTIQLKTGKSKNTPLDVDHTIAYALWERKVEKAINIKLVFFTGTNKEKELLSPDGFASKQESLEFINLLGNCSLLWKSFNISKSDKTMKSFLSNVHEFKGDSLQISGWEAALSIDAIMMDPEAHDIAQTIPVIKQRDEFIRSNLIEFINGTKFRVD